MRTGFYGAVASAALLGLAAQAGAATITIDKFTDSQRVIDVPASGSQVNSSQAAASTAIGGFRDLEVNNFGDRNEATELQTGEDAANGPEEGLLQFSNDSQAEGEGFITYDGNDDPTSVDTDGLGGRNLVLGSQPFFNFDVVKFDSNLFIQVDAWDTGDGQSTYTETLPAAEDFSPILPFADFSATAGGGVDFTDVGALQFYVKSTNVDADGALDDITVSAIPLPASALFLLGGLGGLPLLRTFRRRSS